jgi:hypothetical protein
MPHCPNATFPIPLPHVTHAENASGETERFIAEIGERSFIGYKYFDFQGGETLTLTYRSKLDGRFFVMNENSENIGVIELKPSEDWAEASCKLDITPGVHPLYLVCMVNGDIALKELRFS